MQICGHAKVQRVRGEPEKERRPEEQRRQIDPGGIRPDPIFIRTEDASVKSYGFIIDEIRLPAVGQTVEIQFRGLATQDNIGYRCGLVSVNNDDNPTYIRRKLLFLS